MKKLLIIVGPTATGKTGLGSDLAKKFGGEIVSADSRQIYKYMDIGTGKDLCKFSVFNFQFSNRSHDVGYYEIDGVKIWLYDVIKPNQRFSAVEYAKLAEKIIGDILKREKLPILIGGSGFYIKAIFGGIETSGVEPDWELRKELDSLTIEELKSKLKEIDYIRFKKMNNSDRNNPRRLIRAIEIAKQKAKLQTRIKLPDPTGGTSLIFNAITYNSSAGLRRRPSDTVVSTVLGKSKKKRAKSKIKKCKQIIIGLITDRKTLYGRIDQRVEDRVEKGAIDEIKNLLGRGYSWNDPGFNALGYKEWKAYFSGKATKKETIQTWKYDEHGYARRQLTWFSKNKEVRWFDITESNFREKVDVIVNKWYHK